MKKIQVQYENTLKIVLLEVLQKIDHRKIIILGRRRISAVIFCALRSMGKDIAYFLDPEITESSGESSEVFFWGKPVYPGYYILYENADEIAVINSLHYTEMTDPLMHAYGLEEGMNYFNLRRYQKVRRWNLLDPLLGYSRQDHMQGFHIHGQKDGKGLRIAVLGGATTDYSYSAIKSWPELLHEILLTKKIDNTVFNGGMNGYTSCEERDRMLRDVPALKPDIVISLSGECDIGWIMVSRKHPWYASYYEKKIGGIIKKSTKEHQVSWFSLDKEALYGKQYKVTDYENWINNERIIHAVAKGIGSRFYCFLQPFMLVGNYCMSPFEKGWMEIYQREGVKEMPSLKRIADRYRDFYRGAKELVKEYTYMYDLTGVFDQASGVYSDGVHYDEAGNYLIAEAICNVIMQEGV